MSAVRFINLHVLGPASVGTRRPPARARALQAVEWAATLLPAGLNGSLHLRETTKACFRVCPTHGSSDFRKDSACRDKTTRARRQALTPSPVATHVPVNPPSLPTL